MHLIQLFVISMAGLSAASQAEDSCITVKGAKSVNPVPTVTHTDKETRTTQITKYKQAHKTITPKAVTRTAQKTVVVTISKTLGKGTSKIIATKYITSTVALPVTAVTVTKTITKSATTKTAIIIPTPTGFKAIQDTLSGATYLEAGSERRDVAAEQQERRQMDSRSPLAGNEKRANTYPQKVDCQVTQIIPKTVVSTEFIAALTITANTPIKTIINTQTSTATKTIVPASIHGVATSEVTKVIKETVTPHATIIKTTTTTAAIVKIPGPTTYAACGNKNFANSKNKVGAFLSYKINYDAPVISSDATNPNDCCVACATNYACVGFFFGEACALVKNDGTCSASKPCSGSVEFNPQISRHLYVMGNGGDFQWNRYLAAEP